MKIEELQQYQADFDKKHAGRNEFFAPITPDNIHELEHLIVCLIGEVGELANLAKKISRGDILLEETRSDISNEAADIFAYLLKLCNQLNIDLERTYLEKMKVNERRFIKYRK